MTASTATSPFFSTAATAARRVAAPIARRRGRRPLHLPLALNLSATALIALTIAAAVLTRF